MKKRTANAIMENGFLMDLTFHNVPASLFTEFTEKIVKPYFKGNMNSSHPRPNTKSPCRTRICPF